MVSRESNLPLWAQHELQHQRNRIAELERQLATARDEAPAQGATGRVMADTLGGEGFPLHDRAAVTFVTPTGKITVMLRDDVLDVHSEFNELFVLPRAANVIHVRVGG